MYEIFCEQPEKVCNKKSEASNERQVTARMRVCVCVCDGAACFSARFICLHSSSHLATSQVIVVAAPSAYSKQTSIASILLTAAAKCILNKVCAVDRQFH